MLALAAALGCIVVNSFFVAAEFALAKVRPTALEALAANGDDAAARRAYAITRRLDAYLTATQLGITLASLGLGWLGEPAMVDLLAPALRAAGVAEATSHRAAIAIGFAVISGLHIIVGELVPKSLAIQCPEQVARRTSLALHGFFLLTYPILWVLNGISRGVLRLFGLAATDHAEGKLTLDELRLVVHHGVEDSDPTRRVLLGRVLRGTERPVRAIMVPRRRMQLIALEDDADTWMAAFRRSGFSRLPVSKSGRPDQVLGYVYVKDLFFRAGGRRGGAVARLRRDILVVSDETRVGELLARFERTNVPIAVVVDGRGRTVGLVTHHDVVTQLLAPLRAELEQLAARVASIGEVRR